MTGQPESLPEEAGKRVARLRRRRGLTRQQFADLCGRSVSWVDKVERGERALLRLPLLEQIGAVLGVSLDELCGSRAKPQSAAGLDAFEVGAIRSALQRYDAVSTVFPQSVVGDHEPNVARVRQQVAYAWTAFQNAHYSVLGRVLPALLDDAQRTARACSGDDALTAKALLSDAYQVTASALWKVKEVDLAWLAAERGLVRAEQTGDELLISDAARRVAQGLMTTNHGDQALSLLRADIDRLEPDVGSATPTYLSLYGMAFLLASVVAGRMGDAITARSLLAEGYGVASRLGGDHNERWTAFGPTNVQLHEVAVLVDLGDGRAATDVAAGVRPDGLARLPRERRANFFIDVARGHALVARRDDAVAALLEAEQLAPDEVRYRPVAVNLIEDLQRCGPGQPPLQLQWLAARVGLG